MYMHEFLLLIVYLVIAALHIHFICSPSDKSVLWDQTLYLNLLLHEVNKQNSIALMMIFCDFQQK